MARRRRLTGDREFDELVEEVQGLLLEAVRETIESGSPEPARSRIAVIVEIDEGVTAFHSGPPPGQTVAFVCLIRWLTRSARDDTFRPEPDEVLGWIGQHVGARYRARAGYLIGTLDPDRAEDVAALYAEALGDDFLPTLLWIAAALTALHGHGDSSWLVEEGAAAR
jgi:hypothetical protein